jgi:hypothetical protein
MNELRMSRPVVSVVLLAVAIVFFIIGRYSGLRHSPLVVSGPAVEGASIDLVCGSTKYTVSTGTGGGTCTKVQASASCSDDGGGRSQTAKRAAYQAAGRAAVPLTSYKNRLLSCVALIRCSTPLFVWHQLRLGFVDRIRSAIPQPTESQHIGKSDQRRDDLCAG